MISRLIRVGIDSGEVGYLGPVFKEEGQKDGFFHPFEYIPVPASNQKKTTEKRTYGSISSRNGKYGEHLADFMHQDKHRYQAEGNWKAPLRAADIVTHYDPEWNDNNTFGINKWIGYLPPSFNGSEAKAKDRYIFFFSGLSPYSEEAYRIERRTFENIKNSQIRKKEIYLIGYFRIKGIFAVEAEADFRKHELRKNAHFKEITLAQHPIIVKGYDFPDSRLLDDAVQLNNWNNKEKRYVPNRIGRKIGIPSSPGIRALNLPELNDETTRWLLRVIEKRSLS